MYEREISVLIIFNFTYVCLFFAIFRTYTRRGLRVIVGYVTFDDLAEVILSSTSSSFKGITNRHQPLLSINTLVLLSKTSTMPRGVPALGYRESSTTMERRHPIELFDNAKFIARYRLDKEFVADFSQKFGASEYCPVKYVNRKNYHSMNVLVCEI